MKMKIKKLAKKIILRKFDFKDKIYVQTLCTNFMYKRLYL
jgi:hypothetical protein